MDGMVVCGVCQRHIFAQEARCPFCGQTRLLGEGSAAGEEPRAGISRAQAYAAGIALATGVAAGCGSDVPVAVPPPNPTVNLQQGGQSSPSGGRVLMVAGPADGTENHQAGGSGNGDIDEEDIRRQQELDRQNWERRNWHSCVTDKKTGRVICPPYGCVFPDDACDVLRV